VLQLVAQIAEHAPDFVSTLDELSSILHQMTDGPDGPGSTRHQLAGSGTYRRTGGRATIDDTQLFWQMAVSGRQRCASCLVSTEPGLEMILLRMIAFRPAAVIQFMAAVGRPPGKKA